MKNPYIFCIFFLYYFVYRYEKCLDYLSARPKILKSLIILIIKKCNKLFNILCLIEASEIIGKYAKSFLLIMKSFKYFIKLLANLQH
ncbi:unnamed protein product [Blepharisma stoltei]|uniref:Uncharacterized protein n=1 Tax=Blepharisma stoltei TaxID=1481888 RepID=A0AAU9ICP0_9CILI|nr:unnamed protein product [Blepharisma stoltei]